MDFSPSWTHKSDSLPYQILVLTKLIRDALSLLFCMAGRMSP
jgi:hypothetical protein